MEPLYFFVFLILVSATIGITIAVDSTKHTNHNTYQEHDWATFAKKHNLDFIHAKPTLDTYKTIAGIYLGHKVWIAEKKKEATQFNEINTYIKIYVNRLDNTPSPETNPITADLVTFLDPNQFASKYYKNLTFKYLPQESYILYKKLGTIDRSVHLKEVIDQLILLSENYARVVALRSYAISSLISLAQERFHPLQSFVEAVIDEILAKSSGWSDNHTTLLCTQCLTRFSYHKISLTWLKSFEFYGCRVCKQMEDFYDAPIVSALVDKTESLELYQQNKILYINWLKTQKYFDFNQVNILHANDEDVERFAVYIANNADTTNLNLYRNLSCFVATTCNLNHNTLKVLNEIFGKIIIQEN